MRTSTSPDEGEPRAPSATMPHANRAPSVAPFSPRPSRRHRTPCSSRPRALRPRCPERVGLEGPDVLGQHEPQHDGPGPRRMPDRRRGAPDAHGQHCVRHWSSRTTTIMSLIQAKSVLNQPNTTWHVPNPNCTRRIDATVVMNHDGHPCCHCHGAGDPSKLLALAYFRLQRIEASPLKASERPVHARPHLCPP
ncbi:hypothetical protein BC834DRAFT_873241 [Gloeopeniophorella convolvens]|nr:hypothetical protein BC834DRAFT_873241 [Gloeopeniophorella convolvens]